MTTQHTPTPWSVYDGTQIVRFHGGHMHALADVFDHEDTEGHINPDAAHIVRCVNAHDELVAALRAIHDMWGEPIPLDADARTVARMWHEAYESHREVARAALAKLEQ